MPARSPLLIELPDVLDGPRVRLRPHRPDDATPLWEAVQESREHLEPWMPWVDEYQEPDDVREYLVRARARWDLREDLAVAIVERSSGRLLGGSGLHRMNWPLRTFEIGYWLRRGAEGHGFASEAVQLLTRLAFDTLGANRVEIRVDARNERSRGVAERLGFVLEGTLRRAAADVHGRPADVHILALLPEEYRRLPWAV
ncbi:MAG: GNAT family N-acetyltransferase [Chloroflexota bacterium]|nr:GNAT family N-acetyltransferase [Chloroflexota bacterium]